MKRISRVFQDWFVMGMIVAAGLWCGTARADVTAAWNMDAGGNWSDVNNWAGGSAATGTTGIVDRLVNGGSASTLTVGSNNTSTVFSGVIKNSQPSYPVSLVKIGSGALTLSGVNTYSGMTTISNGTLVVSNNLALSTNTVVLAGGGLGAAAGTWVITNVVNMVSNTTFDTTGTLALMGSVTNNGKLTKMGAGALWVNGSKTGTGDLTGALAVLHWAIS